MDVINIAFDIASAMGCAVVMIINLLETLEKALIRQRRINREILSALVRLKWHRLYLNTYDQI